ncbi:MAG TPA: hypothetical protein VKO87_13545, partial [Gemmatimonadaceae bacterium]|nr:hypothetical protein [Gemmatimonadaceae bacterium]
MKKLITLSLAAFLLAACSDTTTSPNVNPSLAKGGGTGITVAGTLTNNTYAFDDGTFSASDGGTFTVESLTGGFGASAPDLGSVFNDASNRFIGRLDNHEVTLIVPNGGSTYDIT